MTDSAPDATPRPLQRDTFPAHRLMTEHPPVLHDPNKKIVFEVACPPGTTHDGEIGYSRWPAMALPEVMDLGGGADGIAARVEVRETVYDYRPATGIENAVQWHVNFADPRLFTAYGTGLFAQDEMQVAEHPALGALREALHARRWPTLTEERGRATPVLVTGVERRCVVQNDANQGELRPAGLYGNKFMLAKGEAVRRATVPIVPPTKSNLIAIASLRGGRGVYTAAEIAHLLTTAYSGFRAAVLESGGAPAVVHTGFWGCGAFGGNRVLMTMLQLIAARAAGVEGVVFHTVAPDGRMALEAAVNATRAMGAEGTTSASDLVERVKGMNLRWGVSNGS